jgi:nucleoid-associated protein YgaU
VALNEQQSGLKGTPVVIKTDHPQATITLDSYAPNTYSLAKKVEWKDAKNKGLGQGVPQWTGGSRSFSLSVVYDTYEEPSGSQDVRRLTKQLAQLAEPAERKGGIQPPVCTVTWGGDPPADAPYSGLPFIGVVESFTQKFTLFAKDGTPVRAAVDIAFREVKSPDRQQKEHPERRGSPVPARRRTVKRGDTLWSIAFAVYGDTSRWRLIAEANGIVNPRVLEPGVELLIPTVP